MPKDPPPKYNRLEHFEDRLSAWVVKWEESEREQQESMQRLLWELEAIRKEGK